MKSAIALIGLVILASVQAQPVIEAFGELPADTRDQGGDTIGGIGSGITYDANEDVFLCVTDRGPGDGTMPYRPRFVTLKITQDGSKLGVKLLKSTIFKDENGKPMTGLIPDDPNASVPKMLDGRSCIDPEAIALAPDGTVYVTDEYGPLLYQFQRDGTLIRRITLPERFTPRTAEEKVDFRAEAKPVSGRNINQGPEGMCLLPDGKTVALAFQSGLVEMGGRESSTTLLLLLNLADGAPKAIYSYPFAKEVPGTAKSMTFDMIKSKYPEASELAETGKALQAHDLSVNDIYALSDTRFLVLERDGRGRNGAKKYPTAQYKAIWLADCANATNLLTEKTAPAVPVTKSLLFNLPTLVSDPKQLAAKWEGITVMGPKDARELTLMMSADNDFLAPVIYDDGQSNPFPRTEDMVGAQFFKIRAPVAEKP